jgi:hypothetical protein
VPVGLVPALLVAQVVLAQVVAVLVLVPAWHNRLELSRLPI